ncbi:type VI secretion system membrane subunit TssM [Pseudomonas sp. RGM2987]|uniref:type VI secretion system membrane subunit TssM n=1 Tax=Pseudomonas sp. RGM2987 TaxID=2930090 RepID=UPI001FD6F499|nr:type VI secretion system membrane subunit TssM [Pseudomonas sp. RGM2987]MCJ8205741.1 type VI secretion system membrane subunit TssM [Pseudomonas sp. RGM2987]
MKVLFRKTGAWVRQTWVWTLLLSLWVALMVWFVGPLLAVNDYKFWASATARLLTIIVLLLGWGLGMVFLNGRVGSSAGTPGNDTLGPPVAHQARIDQARREVRSRFRSALKALKSSNLYPGRSERWRNDLPWYLLMGPPASGKTRLLDSAGLELSQGRLERDPMGNVSGTGHCEWYFAEHAVLVDTPGRYLTQADNNVDDSAWAALLELMRKRRRRRPLSGVLMTVPVEVLLSGGEAEISALAGQIRGRLQELRRRLHVDMPIYLVLSKADRVPGFNEFFDSLTREENDQVLGASFGRHQRGCDVSLLRAEFEALLQRLNSQVITRMHQERDPLRRSNILDFPHRLEQIGANLCLLVEQGFTGNACTLRGFYLTCASSSSRSGVPSSAVVPGRHSRFIHHLISRLIIPDADLASLDQRERRRLYWGQRAMYLGGLTVLGLFGLLWAYGFSANHERLENLRLLAHRWDQHRSVQTSSDDWAAMLKSLDIRFEATRVFPPAGAVPLYERVGLYQGEASNAAITQAYEHELRAQLLPRIAKRLEEHIRSNRGDREQLLNSVRAYLMLGLEERRDSAWLMDWMASDWSLRYPGDTALQARLNAHFARLLERSFVHALDEPLVAQARDVLRGESLAIVVYRMLRDQASHLPPYRLSHHLGAQGALLVGTDHVIPGFYTRQGYEQYFSIQGATLITRLLRDNWVLGEGEGLSGMDMRRLMVELEQLYFRDYSDRWSEAVGRVALQTATSAPEGAEQLAGLTSAHSPIMQMLIQVRENTRIPIVAEHFDNVAQAAGESGQPIARLAAVAGNVSQVLNERLPDTAQKSLQRRFEPLHRLLGPDNEPTADLAQALRALDEVQLQLASLARASAPDHAAFEMARNRMGGQRDALSHLRSASARLPRPVGTWFNAVAEDSWRLVLNDSYRYLNQRYQSELYSFYAKAINKRYPFNAHSASDVALNDFREFFKDQGVADRFFERYIQPFVIDSAGHYRLRNVDGQGLPVSRVYLDQMAAARTIRRSFFAQNPAEPQVQFTLEPYTLDPTVSRSEFRFGDKLLEYRHGPILPVVFTWPSEAQDGRTALVLEKMVGRGVGIEKNTGPWSLFRLFDLMQAEDLSGRDVRVLKADLGGLRANYLLTSQRTPNPFDMSVLRTFRMPVQL